MNRIVDIPRDDTICNNNSIYKKTFGKSHQMPKKKKCNKKKQEKRKTHTHQLINLLHFR